MTEYRRHLAGEAAMLAFGGRLAERLTGGLRIYLEGDLGAGKTTLVRGILQGRGHQGAVKSPTYTLIEPYSFEDLTVYHLDLYRLADPEELEWIGIRDLFAEDAVSLIEWPERGAGVLPPADILIRIQHAGEARDLCLLGKTERGRGLVADLAAEES